MDLARQNPAAGMALISYKLGYLNATTDEERAFYNDKAETLRLQTGNYTAGKFGLDYNPVTTPSSFTAADSPTYTENYDGYQQNNYSDLMNYGDYSYNVQRPTYGGEKLGLVNSLLGDVTNPTPFSYDYNTDPSYSAYKKEYTREGQRATADTLGSAAAATGGARVVIRRDRRVAGG